MAIKINELVIRATVDLKRNAQNLQTEGQGKSDASDNPESPMELLSLNKINRER